MEALATVSDVTTLWRALDSGETTRAGALLPVVSDTLRQEAKNRGRDLDMMIADGVVLQSVVKAVVVDIVARTLMTSTNSEPMTQMTESAMGYSMSGSFLNPGGGLFIKKSELQRLGLNRQKVGVVDIWG